MRKILKQLKPFIERYPILAATYRAGRDAWVMNHQKSQLTPFGFKFMGHRDMQLGNFEPEETTLIKSFLTKTDVFVDVGANIGFYTCLARSANKYVIAIEPLFQNLSYLVINLIENNWNDVEIYPVGVSDRIGIASLYGSGTGASLIAGWAESSLHHRSAIAVSTLDILLGQRFQGKQLFIKMDIEGGEFAALKGAVNTIKRTPGPIFLVEICLTEHHPNGINNNYKDIFDIFWSNKYEVRAANKHGVLVNPSDIEKWVKSKYCELSTNNYIFIPMG